MDIVSRCPAEKFRAESVHSNEDQSPNSAEDSISLQLHLSPDSEVSKGSSVSPCPYFPSASRIQTRSASRKFSDGQDRASSGNSLASSLFGPGNRRKTLAFGELNFEGQVVKNSSEKNSSQSGQDFLKGVVALVEVYSGNENRSSCIANELESHGATISHRFTNKVTHVIFKEGKQATLEKARSKPSVHLVSVLWVEACKELKIRAAEMSFPVQISDDSLPTHLLFGSKRKRLRSMQPKSLEVETALSEERVKLRKKRAAQSRVRKAIRAYDPFSPDVLASVSRNTTSESPLIPLQNFSPEQDNVKNDSPEPMRSENSFEQTPEDILEGLKSLKEKIKAITENEEDDVSPPSSITPLTEVIINRLFCKFKYYHV